MPVVYKALDVAKTNEKIKAKSSPEDHISGWLWYVC